MIINCHYDYLIESEILEPFHPKMNRYIWLSFTLSADQMHFHFPNSSNIQWAN